MKRRQGSGSVTQRADGRFWVRGPRSVGRPSVGVFDRKEDAEEARAAYARALRNADHRSLPGATLRRAGDAHLAEAAADHAPAIDALRSRWKHIEGAPFIDDALVDLRQPAIDAWARSLRRPRGPLAPTYVSAILALLSSICGRAVREGTIAANPCAGLRLPRERRTEEPWTYLLPDEQERLLAAPVAPDAHALIAVALGTGLREGELFSLRLADVHLETSSPYARIRFGGDGKATKGGSVRRIPLFGLALDALRSWLPQLAAFAPRNPRGLLFPGPRGGARDVGHPLRHRERMGGKIVDLDGWDEALALAGIDAAHRHDGRPVRWHDLRHTCATSLLCGWWGERWRLEDVCQLLRHSSTRVTERYAHLAPSVVAELGARTGGVWVGYGEASNPAGIAQIPLKPYIDGSRRKGRATQGESRLVPHLEPTGGDLVAIERLRAIGHSLAAEVLGWDSLEQAIGDEED